jgi:hypothetical protein
MPSGCGGIVAAELVELVEVAGASALIVDWYSYTPSGGVPAVR